MINVGKDIFGKLALFQMARNKYGFAGFMLVVAAVLIVAGVLIRERNRGIENATGGVLFY